MKNSFYRLFKKIGYLEITTLTVIGIMVPINPIMAESLCYFTDANGNIIYLDGICGQEKAKSKTPETPVQAITDTPPADSETATPSTDSETNSSSIPTLETDQNNTQTTDRLTAPIDNEQPQEINTSEGTTRNRGGRYQRYRRGQNRRRNTTQTTEIN